MKQTAVEWLVEQLLPKVLTTEQFYCVEKAKAMEKEQTINTYKHAQVLMVMDSTKQAEQYYNETFKSE